ncbi:MAG: ATP-binding protein [Chloroherpetonaceae bacterium]|nr:ATP-binding protein [Chloroherpetonaceae bacterium]
MDLKPRKIRKTLKRLREVLQKLEVIETLTEEGGIGEESLTGTLREFSIELSLLLNQIPAKYLAGSLAGSDSKRINTSTEVVAISHESDSDLLKEIKRSEARIQSFIQETMKSEISKVSKTLPKPVKKGTVETDDAIRQSEKRLRTIIDSTPLGICITNEKREFEYVNQAYCGIYGYSPDELIGNPFTMIVEKEKTKMWVDLHDKYMLMSGEELKGYSDIRTEWTVMHKTGKPITILADAARIYGTDNRPRKVTFVMNITEFSKLREDLRKSELQLMQAEKMSSLGQMVAGVAHEINTPLGFVKSNLQLLSEAQGEIKELIDLQLRLKEEIFNGTSDTVSQIIDEIESKEKKAQLYQESIKLIANSMEGITRIQELVQDLKNFSRLDEAEQKSVPISDIVDSSLKIASHIFKERGIEIVRNYRNNPNILCFPAQLNQVFLNLFTNAAQAISHSKGKITITSELQGIGSKSSSVVTVEDNGSGIKPENLKKIFEPFFTTKEIGQGTGLGLAIVHKIVTNHNGEILVDSTVGKGTIFTVRIPISNKDKLTPSTQTNGKQSVTEKVIQSPFLDDDDDEVQKKVKK